MKHGFTSGYVYSQNNWIWNIENPHSFHRKPLHSLRVGVWCAVSWQTVVAPIFFTENSQGLPEN
jgi:hypothetical protein